MIVYSGIGVSMDPHNVMQLPWLLPDYQIFHDQVFKWGMDRLPPNMMSYALPERYTLSSEYIWKVDLVVVPPCLSDSMYLNIVKSGRNNEKRRAMIRLYAKMVKDYILQQPDPNPLPQGTKTTRYFFSIGSLYDRKIIILLN